VISERGRRDGCRFVTHHSRTFSLVPGRSEYAFPKSDGNSDLADFEFSFSADDAAYWERDEVRAVARDRNRDIRSFTSAAFAFYFFSTVDRSLTSSFTPSMISA
jgi:hypothetical protein